MTDQPPERDAAYRHMISRRHARIEQAGARLSRAEAFALIETPHLTPRDFALVECAPCNQRMVIIAKLLPDTAPHCIRCGGGMARLSVSDEPFDGLAFDQRALIAQAPAEDPS